MTVNYNKNIRKVINLLDNHILRILSKKEIDDRTLNTLTSIRIEYVQEINSIISSQNTSDMYDKKYWKSYKNE